MKMKLLQIIHIFRHQKPGAGLGWKEPRNENALGLMDVRKRLPGYIGGVKKRDSMFADV